MELTAAEIVAATGGHVVAGDAAARATSFTIDSRLVTPGACFVALHGTRDGHEFVADALARGATVAIVEQLPASRTGGSVAAGATIVQVEDGMAALASLAHHARERLDAAAIVAITGSAGKTATKDLTAAALGRTHAVHASPGSFNNEAGLPLTLLGAPAGVDAVVAELGARFAGNIADLAAIARPTIGVITHVGLAHAEHLGGRDGVAQVKGELVEALAADALAVLNDDCDATPGLAARTKARVLRVGRGTGADVRATDVSLDDELYARFRLESPWGSTTVELTVRGEHQVDNAAQAAAVALSLGTPVAEVAAGLRDARGADHRMEVFRTADGVLVLDDAYNSSPTSAAAAVRSLASLPVAGRRVAVLGEMLELGDQSDAEHAALGALAAATGIDLLIAVGTRAERMVEGARGSGLTVLTVTDPTAAPGVVAAEVRNGDAVLVKASRAIGLERVAEALAHRGAAA
jgi:UDP-N-acetylmuramoyl-tripeptide--D-alanyl-D-alanine ligase